MILPRTVVNTLVGFLALAAGSACSDDRGSNRPPCRPVGGSAVITVRTLLCPTIIAFNVSPVNPTLNSPIDLTSSVVDLDSNNLTFVWTATAGTIADPSVASTTYKCDAPGGATITLTVSDGSCEDTTSIDVVCTP